MPDELNDVSGRVGGGVAAGSIPPLYLPLHNEPLTPTSCQTATKPGRKDMDGRDRACRTGDG